MEFLQEFSHLIVAIENALYVFYDCFFVRGTQPAAQLGHVIYIVAFDDGICDGFVLCFPRKGCFVFV